MLVVKLTDELIDVPWLEPPPVLVPLVVLLP